MGFTVGETGVTELLPVDGLSLETGGAPTLARGPRLGGLSDEVCPHPANPIRSIRLKNSTGRNCDGRKSPYHSDSAEKMRGVGTGCIAVQS